MTRVWTEVLVIVDRYLAVCLPSEVQLRTVRRAKVAVACVTVASAVSCLPFFVEWKTASALDCDRTKLAVANAKPVQLHRCWWSIAYQIVCNCVFRTAIPFVILVTLGSRILARLRRTHFRKYRSSREQTKKICAKTNWRKSLRATLIAVLALFIGCQLPQLSLRVSKLLRQLLPGLAFNDEAMQQADNVTSGLLVVNATANFFIYCIVGTDFRRSLFQLLSAKRMPVCAEKKLDFQLASIQKPTG